MATRDAERARGLAFDSGPGRGNEALAAEMMAIFGKAFVDRLNSIKVSGR